LAQPAEQSPVDISRSTTIRDPNPPHLVFNYGFSNVELRNTYGATDETTPARVLAQEWGTLKASLKTGLPGVMVNGVPYDLIQFHFHTPSEHTVNGRRTDMEIHFVHLIHDGGCASGKRPLFVIGVFIDAGGNSDRELQRLFPPGLPKKNTDDPVTVPGVDLRALLPAGSPTWRYDGGLTAPASDCPQFKPLSTQAVTGDFPGGTLGGLRIRQCICGRIWSIVTALFSRVEIRAT